MTGRKQVPIEQRNADGQAGCRIVGLQSAHSKRNQSKAGDGSYGGKLEHPLGISKLERGVQIESEALEIGPVVQRILNQRREVRGHRRWHRLLYKFVLAVSVKPHGSG